MNSLVINVAATFYMTGLIWFVQIVHYPLFRRVGQQQFSRYEIEHAALTGRVVAAPMLIELVSALFVPWYRVVGLGLLAAIWISTALLQIPCHNRLVSGFDEAVARRLVQTNWIRTVAWTLRSALLVKVLVEHLR